MANYSITLNLRGTAVKSSKQLANNLERADKAAKSLKSSLQGMPNVPTGGVGGGRPTYGSSMGGGIVSAVTSFSTQSGLGTVFRFAGKLNAALAIADALARTAAQVGKIGAKFNLMASTGGAQLLNKGAQILTSPQMGEGIRLLQRRQQARLGFGEAYAAAQERADLLAASYGLDPSNVVSSMNVLTGMKVGRHTINAAQAARLTQAGGLIAQQSGLGFETVMVNIQQMMSQAVPSMRDIRQLLTHAPILGRYALDEMRSKGIEGLTAMEYLQGDKGATMRVLERYLEENPALLTMRARGMVQMANTGFYATLAENPAWLTVAERYKSVMKDVGEALSSLLTALTNSSAISTSIHLFQGLIKDTPKLLEFAATKMNGLMIKAFEALGVPMGGYKEQAQIKAATEQFVMSELRKNPEELRKYATKLGLSEKDSDEEIFTAAMAHARSVGLEKFVSVATPQHPAIEAQAVDTFGRTYKYTRPASLDEERELLRKRGLKPSQYLFGNEIQRYTSAFVNTDALFDSIAAIKIPKLANLNELGGDGQAQNGAISGYGMDRKSLTINFNAPIVEWDSTINADDPQDVVDTVSETIEGAATRAIRIALMGATGTMSNRY